jgi:hypothetical protein
MKVHPEWYQALKVFGASTKDVLTYSPLLFEELFLFEYGRYPKSACDPLWDEFLQVYKFPEALRRFLQEN